MTSAVESVLPSSTTTISSGGRLWARALAMASARKRPCW